MAKIEFNGSTFEYDKSALTDYKTIKAVSKVEENPSAAFRAFEIVFKGKDEEYAEKLGNSLDAMAELFAAVVEDAGLQAKN